MFGSRGTVTGIPDAGLASVLGEFVDQVADALPCIGDGSPGGFAQ
jgi:hypothetical protein